MFTYGKEKLEKGIVQIEKPKPVPQAHEVLIKVLYASICGTDHHIYEMNPWAQTRVTSAHTMGHEFVGRIVELGENVKNRKIGDLVSAETHLVCNECEFCLSDQKHICENTKVLGVDVDGAFAEYICIPEENAILNQEDLDIKAYSIQEPLGNAIHTLMAQDVQGKSVAIVGVGPIGILAVDAAKALGAAHVIAIDVIDYRLNLAKSLGADTLINPLKEDVDQVVRQVCGRNGVDVVCEMSGNPKALIQALHYLKPGGHLSLLGIPNSDVSIDMSHEVVFKGIHIHGITGRHMFKTWDTLKQLIKDKKLHLETIITHVFDIHEIEKGMELMSSGQCGKVVLKVSEDE